MLLLCVFFFFQAEDGIRDIGVTGVQTCALPILITHAPCWPTIPEQIKLMGARPVLVRTHPEDGFTVHADAILGAVTPRTRSEERRVGKECRSRWSPYH